MTIDVNKGGRQIFEYKHYHLTLVTQLLSQLVTFGHFIMAWRPTTTLKVPFGVNPDGKRVPHKALHPVGPVQTHQVALVRCKTLVVFGYIQAKITRGWIVFKERQESLRFGTDRINDS